MSWEHVPITLQQAATTTGNGSAFGCTGLTTATIEVAFNNGATGTVIFEAATGQAGAFYPVMATNLATLATATQTATSGIWQIDVTGLDTIRARISSITPVAGSVTVQGEVTAQ